MRPRVSESSAIEALKRTKSAFAAEIKERYEFKAKDCAVCETAGQCCVDEHFVNVRITRLEAAAINAEIDKMPDGGRIRFRIAAAAEKLAASDHEFFSCPLYDASVGCRVHGPAKPLACIYHACYADAKDVPPPELLDAAEASAAGLETRVYGRCAGTVLLPLALTPTVSDGRREPLPAVKE